MSNPSQDYMRPVRVAAESVAHAIHPDAADNLERAAVKEALIGYAGSILDAVRAETGEAVRQALESETRFRRVSRA